MSWPTRPGHEEEQVEGRRVHHGDEQVADDHDDDRRLVAASSREQRWDPVVDPDLHEERPRQHAHRADPDEEPGPHEALHVGTENEPEQLAAPLAEEARERARDVVDVFDGDAAPGVLLVLTVGARRIDVGEAFDLLFFEEVVLDQSFMFFFGGEDRFEAGHLVTRLPPRRRDPRGLRAPRPPGRGSPCSARPRATRCGSRPRQSCRSHSSADRSASATVDGRCTTMSAVTPSSTRRSAASTSFSVWTSSADNGSSSTITRGLARIARASAMRWRCPPDNVIPCSPILVSRPHGRSCTNWACATSSASSTSWSVASALPRETFSRTLAEKSVASSKPTATWRRSDRKRRVADVDAVDRHPTIGHVVETRYQHRQARLAGARESDEGDRLARLDLEVDVLEDPVAVTGVTEVDRFELHVPGNVPELPRTVRILHAGLAVEHLEDALGSRRGLLGHSENPPERLDRPDDHQEVAHERDQPAEGHRFVADRERADEQHRAEREARQDVQDPLEVDDEPDALHRRVVQDPSLLVEPLIDEPAAAEGLDRADTGRALLDLRREIARVVLHRCATPPSSAVGGCGG